MSVSIRPMQSIDVDETKKLMGTLQDYLSSLREGRLSWAEMEKNYWPWVMSKIEKDDGFALLAETQKKIAGFVIGWIEVNENFSYHPSKWKHGVVQDLYVDVSAQGHKIGKLLMDAAVEFFQRRGVAEYKLHVLPKNPARKFYENYGMHDGLVRMDMTIEGNG